MTQKETRHKKVNKVTVVLHCAASMLRHYDVQKGNHALDRLRPEQRK